MIKIKNKKIVGYLTEKEKLVYSGREMSKEIEKIEEEIKELDAQERGITEKVEPKELIEKGEALKKKIEADIEELGKIGKEIGEIKIAAIPKDMYDRHYALRDKKEKLERERNKVALKIQKIKDRVIPLIKKEVEPQLKEYEDIEKVDIVDGDAVVELFNHLEEFKKNFKKKA